VPATSNAYDNAFNNDFDSDHDRCPATAADNQPYNSSNNYMIGYIS